MHTPSPRFFPLLGLLISVTAFADGFVVLDYGDYENHGWTLRANAGAIHLQAAATVGTDSRPWGLAALDSNGNLIAGFGQAGWLSPQADGYVAVAEILAGDGSAYLLRSQALE